MNNKALTLAALLKSLLSKEDMLIDNEKLLSNIDYARSTLKKAMTSSNPKVIETARGIIEELKLNLNEGSSTQGQEVKKVDSEAERLQKLKDKYKKDGSR